MRYEFECQKCGNIEEFNRSIKEGPPQLVHCPLCEEIDNEFVQMNHVFGTNFILKGDGWPGKDLKAHEHRMGKAKEETDSQLSEDSRNQRVVEEVMSVRRQGRQATDRFKQDNPQKFKDYQDAISKGYRAKAKSFEVKNVN
jgi:predicted nucleic acid-binding Zn ribbon protein